MLARSVEASANLGYAAALLTARVERRIGELRLDGGSRALGLVDLVHDAVELALLVLRERRLSALRGLVGVPASVGRGLARGAALLFGAGARGGVRLVGACVSRYATVAFEAEDARADAIEQIPIVRHDEER